MERLSEKIKIDFFSTFFMFPFSYDVKYLAGKQLSSLFRQKGWVEQPYCIKTGLEYNEFVYFYPYIRDILMKECKLDSEHFGARYLIYDFGNRCPNYSIENWPDPEAKKSKKTKTISLPLKNVSIHLFDTGVGILVFEMIEDLRYENNNNSARSLYDYLFFIGQGRRVYPPYINWEAKNAEGKFKYGFAHDDAISSKECPLKISIDDQIGIICSEEFAEQFLVGNYEEENKYRPYLSSIIRYFLDMNDFNYDKGSYHPIIDDRMFSHSLYSISGESIASNRLFLNALSKNFKRPMEEMVIDKALQLWYQMVFVDIDSPTCQNDEMIKNLLSETTYPRWSNYGSFYGFSRFSSAFIINANAVYYIYNHFQTIYYQIAILQLFYRGSFLAFSKRSTEIAQKFHQAKGRHDFAKSFKQLHTLYQDYIFFRNKYWFKEVTAQDQGIEIYDLWAKKMRNEELMEDIYKEINGLYTLMDAEIDKQTQEILNKLTIIGQIALPVIIAAAFFSMNREMPQYLSRHFFLMPAWCWFVSVICILGGIMRICMTIMSVILKK